MGHFWPLTLNSKREINPGEKEAIDAVYGDPPQFREFTSGRPVIHEDSVARYFNIVDIQVDGKSIIPHQDEINALLYGARVMVRRLPNHRGSRLTVTVKNTDSVPRRFTASYIVTDDDEM